MRYCPILIALVVACSGDVPPSPDADPRGPLCAKQAYDLCTTEHDCTSGVCLFYMTENYMICTQGCDGNTPCPNDKNGTPGTCSNGACKPAAGPNMCHL
ncbi:MAG TPA: hypothetical protein VL326_38050 [Kofleriaceae bacterium]|nr:hypothetical protein [Kofleriaceae bacterium]